MDCDEALLDIPGLLLGEYVAQPVRDHIRGCARCRAETHALEGAHRMLARAVPAPPPGDGEEDLFELVALDAIGAKVAAAPVGHDPPPGLERAVLDRAGLVLGRRSPWARAAPVLLPALGTAAVVLAVLGFGWRGRADDLATRFSTLQRRLGPVGEFVDRAVLTGAVPAPQPTADLLGYEQDNFRLVIHARALPPSPPGHHYEVWLRGKRGRVSCGTFRVRDPSHVVLAYSVGVDPRMFPYVEVTLEPDDGDPARTGAVFWRGKLDL